MKKQVPVNIAAAIDTWLSGASELFTAICGESFTRREVLMTGIGTLAMMAAVAAGGIA